MNNLKNIVMILFLGVFFNSKSSFAEEGDTVRRINDILFYYGQITYTADYFGIDKDNSFLEHNFAYQPFLKDKNILIFEFGLTNSWLKQGNFFVPADAALIYQRNIKSSKYDKNGFQGISLRAKQVFPTGSDEYYSGFDSWAIEPLMGTQFLFGNTHFFFAFALRYWYSYAALPGKKKRDNHLRIEPGFGFEKEHFWIYLYPDYRYIPNKKSSTFFLEFSSGYKITDVTGLSLLYKPRVSGTDFFEYNAAFSYYFNF